VREAIAHPANSQCKGFKYDYHQEASRLRGFDCKFASKVARGDEAEEQALAFLSRIRMLEDWQVKIKRLVQDMDIVRQIENRRVQIDDEIRRLGRAFANGVFIESEYG
jgi:hypothetical protein